MSAPARRVAASLLATCAFAIASTAHDLPPDWEATRVLRSCPTTITRADGASEPMACPDRGMPALVVDDDFDFDRDGALDSAELQCAIDCIDDDPKPEWWLDGRAPTLKESLEASCARPRSAADWMAIGHGRIVDFAPALAYRIDRPINLPLQVAGSLHLRGNGAVLTSRSPLAPPGVLRMLQRLRPSGDDAATHPAYQPPRAGAANACDVELMCGGATNWLVEGLGFVGPGRGATKGIELHGTSTLVIRQCTFTGLEVGVDLRAALSPSVEGCVFREIASEGVRLGNGYSSCETDGLSCWNYGCPVTRVTDLACPLVLEGRGCSVAPCGAAGQAACCPDADPRHGWPMGYKYASILGDPGHLLVSFCTQASVRRTAHDMAPGQLAGLRVSGDAASTWFEESDFVASPSGPPRHFVLFSRAADNSEQFVTRNLRFTYDPARPPESMLRHEMFKGEWPIVGVTLEASPPTAAPQEALLFDLSGLSERSAWVECDGVPTFTGNDVASAAVILRDVPAIPAGVRFETYRPPTCPAPPGAGYACARCTGPAVPVPAGVPRTAAEITTSFFERIGGRLRPDGSLDRDAWLMTPESWADGEVPLLGFHDRLGTHDLGRALPGCFVPPADPKFRLAGRPYLGSDGRMKILELQLDDAGTDLVCVRARELKTK